MKKVLLVAAIVLVAGLSDLFAQQIQINPIPCFNYQVNDQYSAFREAKTHYIAPLREKRDMEVVISSSSSNPLVIFAKVWVVKDNGVVTYGPYTVFPEELLSVPIDNSGNWGVVIKTDFSITASVWIE